MSEMQLFARVFVQILDSSIAEDYLLRHVFEDFFKVANFRTGVVDMTRQALARRFNIPLDALNEKILILESPDKSSRDPEHGGRRIERIDPSRDWGWRILNWDKYEGIRNKAAGSQRVADHRSKKSHEEALEVIVQFNGTGDAPLAVPKSVDTPRFRKQFSEWVECRMSTGKRPSRPIKFFQEQVLWLAGFGEKAAIEIIKQSVRNGWTGLFELKGGTNATCIGNNKPNPRTQHCFQSTTDVEAVFKRRAVGAKMAEAEAGQ